MLLKGRGCGSELDAKEKAKPFGEWLDNSGSDNGNGNGSGSGSAPPSPAKAPFGPSGRALVLVFPAGAPLNPAALAGWKGKGAGKDAFELLDCLKQFPDTEQLGATELWFCSKASEKKSPNPNLAVRSA